MDISIIIVNWNTRELLRKCLISVQTAVLPLNVETVVVDNGSADGSVDMVKKDFPSVQVIANTENLGFAAANNQGLRMMQGRYALLLNSDTVLTDGAVQTLFTFMESHPDAAMACGQLLNADGSKQHSFASFPTLVTLLFNMPLLEMLFPKRFPSKRYDYVEPIKVDSGIGACLMVRRAAIDDVGLLDERYFFFFEETDWALAMRRAEWQVYFVPQARIYHFQGQSVGRNLRSRILFYTSRYAYFKKWMPRPSYLLIRAILLWRLIINFLFTSLGVLLTLGLIKSLRDKGIVYGQLIGWHIKTP